MPEPTIDLNSLLSESSAVPQVETPEPQQPEIAAEVPETEAEPVETPTPSTLKALAEQAGIDLKDLYAATDSDGRTLSEMADNAKELGSLTQDRESFEDERVQFRAEKAQVMEQLNTLQAAISSGKNPEQAAQALQDMSRTNLEREQRMLLSSIPEWKDGTIKQADVESMVEYMAPFGFTVEDLSSISDHRSLAFIRHHALQARRLSELLSSAEKAKPKGIAKGKAKPLNGGGDSIDLEALIKGAN